MQVTVKLRGIREIREAFEQLPRKINRKILNDGLIAGARLVRDEAKARVPLLKFPDPRRLRGALQRAIHAGRVRPEGRAAATVWIRVRPLTKGQISRFKKARAKKGMKVAGALNPNDPFYWRFVEFGTSKMAAWPFLRPAFEARKYAMVDRAMDIFRLRVQAEIAKLGQRSYA